MKSKKVTASSWAIMTDDETIVGYVRKLGDGYFARIRDPSAKDAIMTHMGPYASFLDAAMSLTPAKVETLSDTRPIEVYTDSDGDASASAKQTPEVSDGPSRFSFLEID